MKSKRPPVDTKKPPVRALVKIAADIWNTTESDILSKSRFREHARPRQAVCHVAYYAGWSGPHIGSILSGRDHSTIRMARDMAVVYAHHEPEFRARFSRFKKEAKAL